MNKLNKWGLALLTTAALVFNGSLSADGSTSTVTVSIEVVDKCLLTDGLNVTIDSMTLSSDSQESIEGSSCMTTVGMLKLEF